jgi:hypothetical protein
MPRFYGTDAAGARRAAIRALPELHAGLRGPGRRPIAPVAGRAVGGANRRDSCWTLFAQGGAAGEKAPGGDIEKTKTMKADIGAGLAASNACCDKVWAATADASAAAPVKMPFGPAMPRLSALSFNTSHDFEHYGNIVTYMRLNKMVPPSSQGQGMR